MTQIIVQMPIPSGRMNQTAQRAQTCVQPLGEKRERRLRETTNLFSALREVRGLCHLQGLIGWVGWGVGADAVAAPWSQARASWSLSPFAFCLSLITAKCNAAELQSM